MLVLKATFFVTLVCGVFIAFCVPLLIPIKKNNFDLVCETKSNPGDIPISVFRSDKTGLHLIFAKIDGPNVQGYFTIPTEAQSDDGLPHTLEHLVFLGSEEYPFKGVLDLLANRCLASGTNAWTAIDHTAYTVKTAGKDGFLNLFPIFMDHLLYPTLTDSGFTTEIYHVTGEGEDAGVVYSEMQSRENTGSVITYTELLRAMYPYPSGFRYETGGIMANLRNLTIDKIRRYHKEMYRPENLYVIITGQVEHLEVFDAVEAVERKIISKGDRGPFTKPWQDPVPPLTESQDLEFLYPSSAEDNGIIRVGWRGPSTVTDVMEYQSMEVLLKYLTDVSVSPLPQVFVEVEDPLASAVGGSMLEYSVSSCVISFSGVPKAKISDVWPLLSDTLRKISEGEIPIDLQVVGDTLNNLILKQESLLETSPHNSFAEKIIQQILFGDGCEYLDKLISKKLWYEQLIQKPASYWRDLMKKYLISSPSVVIKGIPSIAQSKKLQEEEKQRVADRKERLGAAGLKEIEDKVTQAKLANEIPPPDSMLQSVPVPSTAAISFHSLQVFTNVQNHSSGFIPESNPSVFNLSAVSVKMQVDDIKSNLVQLVAIMDTKNLTERERLYLPLLMQLLLESPIVKEGQEIPYSDVVKQLHADTLMARTINGLQLSHTTFTFGAYFQNVGLNFKVRPTNYEKGVEWISDILFRVVFKPERVSVKASKLLNSIGDSKRSGATVLSILFNDAIYKSDTNRNRASIARQETFLKELTETLKTNPTKIITDLQNIYKNITHLDNLSIHMATNLEKLALLTNVTKPWTHFSPADLKATSLRWNVISDADQRKAFTENQQFTGHIIGLKSLESSYLYQTAPSISNYSHTELPALLIANAYLTQMEGPMWKQIRGRGLSYNYRLTLTGSSGLITFQLRKTAQLVEAYKQARNIINSYLNGTVKWNRILFESARSALIYEIVGRENDISDLVQQSILAYYRKVPHDYNRSFLKALDAVNLEDLDVVAQKYIKPMMIPNQSTTGIVCPDNKVQEIKMEFEKLGHTLQEIPSLEDSDLALI